MSARRELLDALVAEQHNGGGFKTPPRTWNAAASTADLTLYDDDVTRARRRRDGLAEWDSVGSEEATG